MLLFFKRSWIQFSAFWIRISVRLARYLPTSTVYVWHQVEQCEVFHAHVNLPVMHIFRMHSCSIAEHRMKLFVSQGKDCMPTSVGTSEAPEIFVDDNKEALESLSISVRPGSVGTQRYACLHFSLLTMQNRSFRQQLQLLKIY